MPSSDLVACLIKSNPPARPQSVSGVRQVQSSPAGPTLTYKTNCRIVSAGGASLLSSKDVASAPIDAKSLQQSAPISKQSLPIVRRSQVTGPCMPLTPEEEWVDKMLDAVDKIDAKHAAKYSPLKDGDVIHSAEVAVPKVDFSKVKPHLHRNLPNPSLFTVQ